MRRRHKVRYEPPCGPSGQREQSNGDQKAAEETESCSQVLLAHVRHLDLHGRRRTRSILAKWAVNSLASVLVKFDEQIHGPTAFGRDQPPPVTNHSWRSFSRRWHL